MPHEHTIDKEVAAASIFRSPRAQGRPGTVETLEMILDYELRSALRYRRFASLVLISHSPDRELMQVLDGNLRACDQVFEINSNVAVLMAETDKAGALIAIGRIREVSKGLLDVRFAIASFPEDARGTAELLWAAHRRLDKAQDQEVGTAVTVG